MRAAEMARCREIIDRLPNGLDTVVGSGGTHLSGGENQRIALARAILKDAPIIVLDDNEIIELTRKNPIKSRVLPC